MHFGAENTRAGLRKHGTPPQEQKPVIPDMLDTSLALHRWSAPPGVACRIHPKYKKKPAAERRIHNEWSPITSPPPMNLGATGIATAANNIKTGRIAARRCENKACRRKRKHKDRTRSARGVEAVACGYVCGLVAE